MKLSRSTLEPVRDDPAFHSALAEERARIIRYCARFVGDTEVAEDLAQETFFEALRHVGELRDRTVWRSWLTGIARNVCLRFITERKREQSRYVDTESFGMLDDFLPDTSEDPLRLLERNERELLIDRALGRLPDESRQLLVDRYLEDKPVAELEGRYGITENHLNVRLHRSRIALRQVLFSDAFREEIAAYGLRGEGSEREGWQATNIWCPRCGQFKLEGRFSADPDNPSFESRCPSCRRYLGMDFTSKHPQMNAKRVLGSVKGFKPALNRIHQWWWEREQQALADGSPLCFFCNRRAEIRFTPPSGTPAWLRGMLQFYIACPHCGNVTGPSALGMAVVHPEVQRFWRRNPRMQSSMECATVPLNNGTTATLATFQSLTSEARIELLFSDTNASVLEVRTNDTSAASPDDPVADREN